MAVGRITANTTVQVYRICKTKHHASRRKNYAIDTGIDCGGRPGVGHAMCAYSLLVLLVYKE